MTMAPPLGDGQGQVGKGGKGEPQEKQVLNTGTIHYQYVQHQTWDHIPCLFNCLFFFLAVLNPSNIGSIPYFANHKEHMNSTD